MTTKLAEDRARKLQHTGVPLPFDVEFRSATSHPRAVESTAHVELAPFRVAPNREFFRCPPSVAIGAVENALLDAAGLPAWATDHQHFVKHGDRIAITMRAGDLFVVLSYPHLMARQADPIDIWQAHSNGDSLELMGSATPGHVAGFSDGDPGGEADPVPYVDRAGTTPNGSINGRERLMPGERLLWLRPVANGESCALAMFEMQNHCQVISRTWNLKLTPHGHPLILNIPSIEELPPCAVRAVRGAMRMAFPRRWAPRSPDPTEGWTPVASDPPPPEYWLRQLEPPTRRRGDRI
ncbi:GIY-YIG nuclease family protein [Actinomadura mexicana]|uniref:T5orf172 domain-containing protein n=1 Tax=Actinomadura mexicana TaxID=134959 RepID=A0A238VNN1_9ACTN|nr:T5orf172 domain-containing protein [Actinomadura mexicana]